MAPYLADSRMAFAPVQREVVAEAIQANLIVLSDAPHFAEIFIDETDPATCQGAPALMASGTPRLFELAKEHFGRMPAEFLPSQEARELLRALVEAAKAQGIKGKAVYQPLRVALSAREEGPELYYLVGGLGKTRILRRLDSAARYAARWADPTL